MATKKKSSLRDEAISLGKSNTRYRFLSSMSAEDIDELVDVVLDIPRDPSLSSAAILRALQARGIVVAKTTFNYFVQDVLKCKGLPDGVATRR